MTTYEQLLDADLSWALEEGSMHFEQQSAVHKALQKITHRLDELGVPYALVGGMALFFHGVRRFTEDVDILVTPAGLEQIHERLTGLGYVPRFTGSKHLRDAELGVRIEFLVTGQYPGDGLPKPIAFPDPITAAMEIDGISVLALPRLLELKLASGMTGAGRLRDLADVESMIQLLHLCRELAEQLNPYVRDKYLELWQGVQQADPDAP